ncbi:unnamed protein product [Clonostachys rosea]|uniref:Transcription factor CBF/NF-Y/archaeal histone domain-containing protein n=1 Tax=Bionectria ochroleuca TaxID=29856 RepID=A0ABY6V1D1_BIOOC|nr:unnamed protein product [Clonostachys rosea]
MSADESSSYAPKSPDLSALFSADAPTDQHQPPAPPPFSLSQSQNFHQAHHHHQQPSYYPQPQSQPHSYSANSAYLPPATTIASPSPAHPHYTENIAYIPAHHHPQPQHLQQQQHQQRQFSQLPQQLPPTSYPNHIAAYGHQNQPRSFEPTPLYAQPHLEQLNHPPVTAELHNLPHATAVPVGAPPQHALHLQTQMPPRRAAAAAVIEEPIIEPSPVRTKFPTARIKRIMQADEEVGKVAQQTPIAVGKALELFMVQLVSTSADIAKDKGSKRVTASMLKQVVERDDQWDFLREIVGKVENEKEGKPKQTKGESESDEDAYEPKKKTRGGRKKKGSV